MNLKFKRLLSEYIPISKNGVRFEVEMKKLNISRKELSELFGIALNTLARKLNKNSQYYKKKQKRVIDEWALYGIKCAINDIKSRAEEVKKKRMSEAKELVTYTEGKVSEKELIVAEKSKEILESIKVHGRNITEIAKDVNLSKTTVIRYIKKDPELTEELDTSNDEAVLLSQEVLKNIVDGGDEVSNKDKISAINAIFKNNKSIFLNKEEPAPPPPSHNIFPNSNILMGNIVNNKNNNKPAKKLISNADGEEFIILSEEEEISKKEIVINKKEKDGKLSEEN